MAKHGYNTLSSFRKNIIIRTTDHVKTSPDSFPGNLKGDLNNSCKYFFNSYIYDEDVEGSQFIISRAWWMPPSIYAIRDNQKEQAYHSRYRRLCLEEKSFVSVAIFSKYKKKDMQKQKRPLFLHTFLLNLFSS